MPVNIILQINCPSWHFRPNYHSRPGSGAGKDNGELWAREIRWSLTLYEILFRFSIFRFNPNFQWMLMGDKIRKELLTSVWSSSNNNHLFCLWRGVGIQSLTSIPFPANALMIALLGRYLQKTSACLKISHFFHMVSSSSSLII